MLMCDQVEPKHNLLALAMINESVCRKCVRCVRTRFLEACVSTLTTTDVVKVDRNNTAHPTIAGHVQLSLHVLSCGWLSQISGIFRVFHRRFRENSSIFFSVVDFAKKIAKSGLMSNPVPAGYDPVHCTAYRWQNRRKRRKGLN